MVAAQELHKQVESGDLAFRWLPWTQHFFATLEMKVEKNVEGFRQRWSGDFAILHLTDPMQFRHSQKQFGELGRHVWILSGSVMLQGLHNFFLRFTNVARLFES